MSTRDPFIPHEIRLRESLRASDGTCCRRTTIGLHPSSNLAGAVGPHVTGCRAQQVWATIKKKGWRRAKICEQITSSSRRHGAQ